MKICISLIFFNESYYFVFIGIKCSWKDKGQIESGRLSGSVLNFVPIHSAISYVANYGKFAVMICGPSEALLSHKQAYAMTHSRKQNNITGN